MIRAGLLASKARSRSPAWVRKYNNQLMRNILVLIMTSPYARPYVRHSMEMWNATHVIIPCYIPTFLHRFLKNKIANWRQQEKKLVVLPFSLSVFVLELKGTWITLALKVFWRESTGVVSEWPGTVQWFSRVRIYLLIISRNVWCTCANVFVAMLCLEQILLRTRGHQADTCSHRRPFPTSHRACRPVIPLTECRI